MGIRDAGTIAIIYDADALTGDVAARDVLEQIEAFEAAIREGGGVSVRLGVTMDLGEFSRKLREIRPGVVVNLVESLGGMDRLQSLAPVVLEGMGIPFTGTGSMGMLLSNHKILSKKRYYEAGLPVAEAVWLRGGAGVEVVGADGGFEVEGCEWILKALESHASVHLDDGMVVGGLGVEGLAKRLGECGERFGEEFFAERFIDGREFNVSLLEGVGVLPVAEIDFGGLGEGRRRIVGFAAKWEEGSGEYRGTVRVFAGDGDAGLVDRLGEVARGVWDVVGMGGYGRVDFRVDGLNRLYVLEANTNPCLTPGAGFAAAVERAGISYVEMVSMLLSAKRT